MHFGVKGQQCYKRRFYLQFGFGEFTFVEPCCFRQEPTDQNLKQQAGSWNSTNHFREVPEVSIQKVSTRVFIESFSYELSTAFLSTRTRDVFVPN